MSTESCQVCGSYDVVLVSWSLSKDEWSGWCARHLPPLRQPELWATVRHPLLEDAIGDVGC